MNLRSIGIALGALAAVVLLVVVFFWVGRSSDGAQPDVRPVPVPRRVVTDADGGVRWRPHPDRAGLRYTPHP